MQQSVMLTSLRAPDGLQKNHISKLLIRWLRRCVLLSAFDGAVLEMPYDTDERRGGSFTGASLDYVRLVAYDPVFKYKGQGYITWQEAMDEVLSDYLRATDEMPHHFQAHFMHAAQILGFKHPDLVIRAWWNQCYARIVNELHLFPESEEQMNKRLGDNEAGWREREEVIADGP
jgi:hypothetical protein